MSGFELHNFFRSSTSFRTRAALNFKGIEYEYVAYHLRSGEHRSSQFSELNPQCLVPALKTPEGTVLSQSTAIIEYLDEVYPEPPLLPSTPLGRARVRSLAMMIASDIHPINNLRVLKFLASRFGADDHALADWFRHWVTETFTPLEYRLATESDTGRFCHGNVVSIADICLSGQVINNARFDIDMAAYPTIQRIHDRCMSLAAFEAAAPAMQPDAE